MRFQALSDLFQAVRSYAGSVVQNADQHLLPRQFRDADFYMQGQTPHGHPVLYRVFHQGLEDHLRHVVSLHTALPLHREPGPVLIAGLLDRDIALQHSQLLPCGHEGFFREHPSQQAPQLDDHLGGSGRIAPLDHPVQGIIEKMGIDLGLEHLIPGILDQQLLFVVFVDQLIDLGQHDGKLLAQPAGLILTRLRGEELLRPFKIPLLHHLHGDGQLL